MTARREQGEDLQTIMLATADADLRPQSSSMQKWRHSLPLGSLAAKACLRCESYTTNAYCPCHTSTPRALPGCWPLELHPIDNMTTVGSRQAVGAGTGTFVRTTLSKPSAAEMYVRKCLACSSESMMRRSLVLVLRNMCNKSSAASSPSCTTVLSMSLPTFQMLKTDTGC